MSRGNEWWDRWFLGMAQYVASASKDPSTQTGAVIVDLNRRVVSVGFNGLPRGVKDTDERLSNRELKYKLIVHAERNALLFAQRSLVGCTLYGTLAPCGPCAAMIIQTGIVRCVAFTTPDHLKERWEEELEVATMMFREAGLRMLHVSP